MGLDEVLASREENREHEDASENPLRKKNRLAELEHTGVDRFRRVDETRKEQARETLHCLNRELGGAAVGDGRQEVNGEEDFRWVLGLLNARNAQIDLFLRKEDYRVVADSKEATNGLHVTITILLNSNQRRKKRSRQLGGNTILQKRS